MMSPLPAFMPVWGHSYSQSWTTGPKLQYPENNNKLKKRTLFFFSLDLLSGPGSTPSQSCLSLFSVTSSSRLHDPTCLWPSLTRTFPSLFPHPAHFCPLSSSLLSLSVYLASFLLWILHILYIPSHFSLQPSYHHVNLVPFPLSCGKQSSAVVVLVVLESFWLRLSSGFTLLTSCLTLGEPLMLSESQFPQL